MPLTAPLSCSVVPASVVSVPVPVRLVARAVVKLAVVCSVPSLSASGPAALPRLASDETATVPPFTVVPPL